MTITKDKIYQFKIKLAAIKPVIWRRVQIASTDTFADFHDAIQTTMGWERYHSHDFLIKTRPGTRRIGILGDEEGGTNPAEDGMNIKLDQIFTREKQTALYVYDFGDNWWHNIVLEKILEVDHKKYPRCLAGRRACPPENCGGPLAYKDLLEILKDQKHEQHETLKKWYWRLDPEFFNISDTNKLLQNTKSGELNTNPANHNNITELVHLALNHLANKTIH